MAFSINDLATELGIDPASLAPESVTKWNGYLSEADAKYTSATQAQKDAEDKLAAVQSEQEVINAQIARFGETEATTAALRANYAAMEASLKTLKEQGFDVNIPTAPVVNRNEPAKFDPTAFQNDVNSTLVQGFNVTNRYQRLYGQPIPDDLDQLAREAVQARKPFAQYVADKYDFVGKEKSMQAETQKKHDDEIRAAAVKEYQEKNPNTHGNPDLARGVASRHPQVLRTSDKQDNRKFSNMGVREKIAASLSNSKKMLEQAS